MANFKDHIAQAKKNLIFFQDINRNVDNCIDWQVTVCFYTALHLVNAHLSKFGLQYRRHSDVKHALNPKVQTSPSKLPEDEYVAYATLQMLSRRSRYLVNEKDKQENSFQAYFTYDKHLAKAIKHLDCLVHYFRQKYNLDMLSIKVDCKEIRRGKSQLQHFEIL